MEKVVGKRYSEDMGDKSEELFLNLYLGGYFLYLWGFSVCVFSSLISFHFFIFVNVFLLEVGS